MTRILERSLDDGLLARLATIETNLLVNWLDDLISHAAEGVLVDGAAWDFDTDELGATSTGETYDATGDYYHNPPGQQVIAGGSNIGNMTENGGLAAAFDSNTVQATAACAVKTGGGALGAQVGKSWGASKLVVRCRFFGSSDAGFQAGNTGNYAIQGSSNGTDWTTIASGTYPSGTSSPSVDVTSGLGSTAYAYHRVAIDPNAGSARIAEVEFYEATTPLAMTLIPAAATAQAQPTDARLVALWRDETGGSALGTDFIAEVSRDNGTTWTAVTLTNEGAFDATYAILAGSVDVSAQPAGTSMKFRLRSLNGKHHRVRAVAMLWG